MYSSSRRDYALSLFLYNAGARADEAAHLTIGNVGTISSSVSVLGKGRNYDDLAIMHSATPQTPVCCAAGGFFVTVDCA